MKNTSAILKALAGNDKERVTVADIVRQGGSRAHGFALLMIALPETLPLPIPSASIILAVPLVLISAHLLFFGEGRGIPERARKHSISAATVRKIAAYVAPVFETLEHVSRQRFEALARQERFLAAVCLLLSVILLMPIPFGNLVPAVCLVTIAFGMLQRDGVVVALGLAGAAACTAALIYFVNLAGSLFA
jgi:hypothetical protein